MGTWDIKAFGNDYSLDWVLDLAEHGEGLIRKALTYVSEFPADDYLDSVEASEALAAIAIVALTRSATHHEETPEEVEQFLADGSFNPSPELVGLCLKAYDRILGDNSDLKGLWEDSNYYEQWLAYMAGLKQALA